VDTPLSLRQTFSFQFQGLLVDDEKGQDKHQQHQGPQHDPGHFGQDTRTPVESCIAVEAAGQILDAQFHILVTRIGLECALFPKYSKKELFIDISCHYSI